MEILVFPDTEFQFVWFGSSQHLEITAPFGEILSRDDVVRLRDFLDNALNTNPIEMESF